MIFEGSCDDKLLKIQFCQFAITEMNDFLKKINVYILFVLNRNFTVFYFY